MTQNRLGQMYALTVMTPVDPARTAALERMLADLPRQPSPFARMHQVHFARWVMVPDFVADPSQPAPEHLPAPYLLLSATFDGSLDTFLEELTRKLASETAAVYGCCIGAPEPAAGEALGGYLRHNQVPTGLFFSAYPEASVETVTEALDARRRLIEFAVDTQGAAPEALLDAFRQRF